MPTWSRRRIETILLAILALVALIPFRYLSESRVWFLSEFGSLCIAFLVAETSAALSGRWRHARLATSLAAVTMPIIPVFFAVVARWFGSPIAFEMSALGLFGATSVAMATAATTNRTRSLSLIISGFLVLFCAFISDDHYAVVLPLVWMLGCVWHLVANHWERLDLAMPESVVRNRTLRPNVIILASLVLAVAAYAVHGRMGASKRFAFGIMPTSGGSSWSDPAARSGVGDGDMAIAAKDHAESFGAVDSDIFLETSDSTLFDMVNDLIGEPTIKNKSERRQGIGNNKFIPMHDRASKSERGGGTFSTERMPPKKHRHFQDANDASVVQWDGPTGIRLAMHRYDTFDGRDWSQSADLSNERLTRVDIREDPWFFDPKMKDAIRRNPDATSVGLLKVIRLDSARIPAPMLTGGVHINKVDRRDFFGLSKDGSFFMPGRERVPPMTVVHLVSANLMEDEIRDQLATRRRGKSERLNSEALDDSSQEQLRSMVQSACAEHSGSADQLNACIETLRTDFVLDRDEKNHANSLKDFLKSRRGGDHLFATTAALMANQLGLDARLVTGFYVRPGAFDIAAGHSSVLADDVHVWTEVRLNDGRWFEVEPTPGYQPPHYQPSWRLVTYRFLAKYWPIMAIGALALAILYVSRSFWIDWSLAAAWSLAGWLRPRQRLGLAIRIIEVRARLAGARRPKGKSQRAWLEQLAHRDVKIAGAVRQFSDAADSLFFGHGDVPKDLNATGLVKLLRVRTICTLTKEATS